MNSANIRQDIQDTLAKFGSRDFDTSAKILLETLGYYSERIPQNQTGRVVDFLTDYPATNAPNSETQTEQQLKEHAESVHIIFQVASEEIEATASGQQTLFSATEIEKGRAQSFVFAAAELKDREYPRGLYARLAREISKRLPMPIVLLFRTSSGALTIAFINRRANKRIADRDVLGDVSLIRQIDTQDPHRAHVDILAELSLDDRLRWMDSNNRPHNFDGLLAAWLNSLDTEALNKRFYDDLFKWFEHAKTQAKFPKKGAKVLNREDHIIRLITRMLFVWFFKEKGLIAKDLFNEGRIASLLRDYDNDEGDSYYRAVLQNLFFATLNAEMKERDFSRQDNSTHRLPSYYRYESEIADPDSLLGLFNQTPFINGGLFECLDSEKAIRDGGWRIDCFTDNLTQRRDYSIPNRLFFGENGLIDLFNRYKFTVEENTPVEQEVALDPELLGKVFENLLAAYNPETRETARRLTGSFYTPRIVVDYMVDEALVASLCEKLGPNVNDRERLSERLRYLLSFSADIDENDDLFTMSERVAIVRSIAEIKLLDPAVGSGAFPMSMLQKLTLALRRLDEHNELWEEMQKEIASHRAATAFDIDDSEERADELEGISEIFEKYRESDFGRKLYLIQSGIYGVDIQPVAIQIAKLRFFISLAIEQEAEEDTYNFGIKPLPNLETRFVAANTLLSLRNLQSTLSSERTRELQDDLRQNRERHFHANERKEKRDCVDRDKQLRRELAAELIGIGLDAIDSDKIAAWDPYDHNARADWFDAEYMFGVSDGFDVVIGNPPYISHDRIEPGVKVSLQGNYVSYEPYADTYCYFMEKSASLLGKGGISALITSNSYLRAEYGAPIRHHLRRNLTLLQILNIEESQVFENVIVNVAIILAQRHSAANDKCHVASARLESNDLIGHMVANGFFCSQAYFDRQPWNLAKLGVVDIQDKIYKAGATLAQLGTKIRLGLATGYNDAFVINEEQRRKLLECAPRNSEIIKPVLRGRHISRFSYEPSSLYIILAKNGVDVPRDFPDIYKHLSSFGDAFRNRGAKGRHWTNLRACAFYDDFKKEQIIWTELTDLGRFTLSPKEIYLLNSAYFLIPPEDMDAKFLLGILNSSTIQFYLSQIAGTSGMGTNRWINSYVSEFPIPVLGIEEQAPLSEIVSGILKTKASNSMADTSSEEYEINRLVYELYGLTDDEIAVIEGASN